MQDECQLFRDLGGISMKISSLKNDLSLVFLRINMKFQCVIRDSGQLH